MLELVVGYTLSGGYFLSATHVDRFPGAAEPDLVCRAWSPTVEIVGAWRLKLDRRVKQ